MTPVAQTNRFGDTIAVEEPAIAGKNRFGDTVSAKDALSPERRQLLESQLELTDKLMLRYPFGQLTPLLDEETADRIPSFFDEEDRAKLSNTLLYSSILGQDPDALYGLADEINNIIYGNPSNVPALKQNVDLIKQSKSWTDALSDGVLLAGVNMNADLKKAGYMVADLDKNFWEWIGEEQPEFLRKLDDEAFEISQAYLAATDQFYKENPDKIAETAPGTGILEKTLWYTTEERGHKAVVQMALESAPIMLLATLGKVAALGKAGIVALFGGPTTAQVYTEARNEDTEVTPALGQALLSGAGEGAIEAWTFGKKIGLAKNFSKIVKAGFPKVAWEAVKAFGRGTAEEAGQQTNRNFWRFVFSDANQSITEGVADAAAAGGPVELLMAGVFATGGYAYNKTVGMVDQDMQRDRLNQIRAAVEGSEHLTGKQKREIFAELGKVRKDVNAGVYVEAEEAAKAPTTAPTPPVAAITPAEAAPTTPAAPEGAEGPLAQFDLTTQEGRKDTTISVTKRGREIAEFLGFDAPDDFLVSVGEGKEVRGTSHPGIPLLDVFGPKEATQDDIDKILIHEIGHQLFPKAARGIGGRHENERQIEKFTEEQFAKWKAFQAPAAPEGAEARPAAEAKGELARATDTRRKALQTLTELRERKPSSIAKRFGKKGPTAEQKIAFDAEVKEWNRQFRQANKVFKEADAAEAALVKAKPAPAAEKKGKEPTTLREDVTGILGGLPREPAGLTKAEIEHLGKREQNALRAAQKRGLKVGFKQGAADTILDARRTMAALITKQKINAKDKMDLASIVLTYVPKEHQGRFINRVLNLKTPKAARKLTEKIREAVEKIAERDAFQQAKKSLKKQIKRIPKFGKQIKLRQPAIDKISVALEGVDIAKLSAGKKEELSGIRNELKEVGFLIEKEFEVPSGEELEGIEAVVGERVVTQLQRLQKESIADMTAEEVEAIADAIRYALDQNTKETQERRKAKAERVQKQNQKAQAEITPTKASGQIDTAKRRIPVTIPQKVLGFFRQDSMKRWALVESATGEGLNTTAKVLDQDIHEGKTKAVEKQFEALELLWAEMDRLGWTQQDVDRADAEHTVTLGGQEYELTTSEIMSLGMNVKSSRNAKQIVRTKGLHIAGRDVKTPTIGEIVDAMEVLTDKERAIMDFLPTLNEDVLMPAMNEVSEDMLNFTLARDPFYWGLKRKLPKKVRGRTIQGPAIEDIGAFQPFLGSKITLQIVPFWDQLLTQVQNASSLYGLAMPMENARTLLNNEQWQKAMDAAGRTREKENLITIFQRTQGVASDKDNVDIVGSVLLARAAKAILGWRISTMANQTASIPMAFTVIPDKYVAPVSGVQIQTGAEQSKRIDEYSPTLRMRHVGGRTNIVTGDAAARHSVETLIFRRPADRSLEGMRRTDRAAIQLIDGFVQRWVADTTKLEFGTDNFWKEVARRTEEAVRKTQPMWDVDERSVQGSIPNFLVRSIFIFRSAREAVLNQNLMAIDRVVKAKDKKRAASRMANTLAATTISTAMVVGIRKAMWVATGALFAAITGRRRREEDESLPKQLGIDMIEASVEYLPAGRFIIGGVKTALRQRTFDELDPDAIVAGGPIAITRGMAHLKGAYEAYFEDGDEEKAKKEILGAINDIADGIGRLKGYPTGGILQLTTQPLERALREDIEEEPFTVTPRKRNQ